MIAWAAAPPGLQCHRHRQPHLLGVSARSPAARWARGAPRPGPRRLEPGAFGKKV